MKAVVVNCAGDSSALQVKDVPMPLLKKGWSVVKVLGFGINRSEIMTRQGHSPSVQFPRILGIECVGEIVESDVFAVGTKMMSFMGEMGRAYDGSYAEYTLLPNEQIFPIQSRLSIEQLAALPESYYTAFGAMKNLNITSTDTILVRGGTSSVGIAFLKLVKAKFPSNRVVATTRQDSKKKWLLKEQYDDVILDVDNVLQTAEKFDKILDLIGPLALKNTIAHSNEYGIVCTCGLLGYQWSVSEFNPIEWLENNVYLTTVNSANVNTLKVDEMLRYIEQFTVDISVKKVFSLSDIQQAHDYIESGRNMGKAVVVL